MAHGRIIPNPNCSIGVVPMFGIFDVAQCQWIPDSIGQDIEPVTLWWLHVCWQLQSIGLWSLCVFESHDLKLTAHKVLCWLEYMISCKLPHKHIQPEFLRDMNYGSVWALPYSEKRKNEKHSFCVFTIIDEFHPNTKWLEQECIQRL